MSILIKGMEMPQNCFDCLMSSFGLCNLIEGAPIGNPLKRLDNCPLIELPPHGHLIDADALSSKLTDLAECEWNQSTGTTWAEAFEEVDGFVQDAPTIIEAEGRET